MANEVYKGHTLISTADFNSDTKCWVPVISISWREKDGDFQFHKLDGPANSFHSQEDAIANGFHLARFWVDQKL